MTVDEVIEYTHIPRGTMYMKLEDGTIPATKPGRRWILYQDELDKWLETKRRNSVPMTVDEENFIIGFFIFDAVVVMLVSKWLNWF